MPVDLEPGSGPALLLGWLGRPYHPQKVVSALLGVSPRVARHLIGTVVATSEEAEGLLAAMPAIVRSLAVATSNRPQRCVGEIRGPIMWSETMAARGASAGDPGLFVCATPTRAYDTDENRVLRAALHAVQVAGRQAEGGERAGSAVTRRARHNGQQAARVLEHQTLAGVPTTRPTGRQLRRTRAGTRRNTYRPAVRTLARVAEPLGAAHITAFASDRTRARLDLLAAVLLRVADHTGGTPSLRCEAGELVSGPVRFHHPPLAGPASRWDGVRVGEVLLDVPAPDSIDDGEARDELRRRADGGLSVLVVGADDLAAAVTLALG